MLIKHSLVTVAACFVALACGSEVDVGGPRDTDGGSAGSAGTSSQAPSEGGAPSEPTEDPSSFTDERAPCETDADCCVVVNDCTNTAYVVSADDAPHVAQLIEDGPRDRCTGCIAPLVQVSCQNSKCVGTEIDPRETELGAQLEQNHCGAVEGVQSDQEFRPIFGCGAP
jgi:hypothetical protein